MKHKVIIATVNNISQSSVTNYSLNNLMVSK